FLMVLDLLHYGVAAPRRGFYRAHPTPRGGGGYRGAYVGALAPVIELPSKLQERPCFIDVRGIRCPRRTPVGVFQNRGGGLSPAVQGASDSHRRAAGGEKDLVLLRRPGILTRPLPPGPH